MKGDVGLMLKHFSHIEHLAEYDLVAIDGEPLAEKLVDRVTRSHSPVIVTENGLPVAALVSLDDLAELYSELRCLRALNDLIQTGRDKR
jgi:prevent-host-death family protein